MARLSKTLLLLGLAGVALSAPVSSNADSTNNNTDTDNIGSVHIGLPKASVAKSSPSSSTASATPTNELMISLHDSTKINIASLQSSDIRITANGAGQPSSLMAMAPAMPQNFADPAIVADGQGTYWAFATDDVAHSTDNVMVHSGVNVQVASAKDFGNWTHYAADALPFAGAWAANPPAVWAPDVIRLDDGSYVLYYAATPANDTTVHCVGAAKSTQPQGPYTALSQPLHCPTGEGGAIDPSGFRDPATGKFYVMFKVDGNNGQPGGVCGNVNPTPRATPIRIQEVQADGVTPVGAVVQILDRDASDGPLVEAPSMAAVPMASAKGGYAYVLFFSSQCFLTAQYNVRYAVSTNGVLNGADNMKHTPGHFQHADYSKHAQPLMDAASTGLIGPGGLDVMPDGRHVVFHSAEVANIAGTRHMHWGLVTIEGTTVTI